MSDLALSIVLGVALAAATGFRVFLPMLIVSGAAYTGHLHLDDSFAWLGTPSALIMLSVAAVAEVLAYYIPVVDNLLDTVATPAAFVAGTIVSAAVMIDAPPMVKWTAAVIAGGGVAGLTQGLTGILRAHSTMLTGGLGNPVIATAELGGAVAGRGQRRLVFAVQVLEPARRDGGQQRVAIVEMPVRRGARDAERLSQVA